MKTKRLLLGDEALALGAINAGLSGAYAYFFSFLYKLFLLGYTVVTTKDKTIVYLSSPLYSRGYRKGAKLREYFYALIPPGIFARILSGEVRQIQ